MSTLQERIDSSTNSIISGKESIYNAITNKGVTLSGNSFSELAEGINSISTGGDYLDFGSIFPSSSGTLSDDDYQKVIDAYNNGTNAAKLSTGSIVSLEISHNGTKYNVLYTTSSSSDYFNIYSGGAIVDESTKQYTQSIDYVQFSKTGDGSKFLSDDGSYKSAGSNDYVVTIATSDKQLYKMGTSTVDQSVAEDYLGPIDDLLAAVDAGRKIYIKNTEAKTLTLLEVTLRSSTFNAFSSRWSNNSSSVIELITTINSSKRVSNRGIRYGYLLNSSNDTIIVGGGVQEQYSLAGDYTLTVTPDVFAPLHGCTTTVILSTTASNTASVTIAADSSLDGSLSIIGDNPISIPANSMVELSVMFTQAASRSIYIVRYSEPFTRPS